MQSRFSSLRLNRESFERGKDLRIAFSPSEKPEAFKRHPLQDLQIVFHVDIFYHLQKRVPQDPGQQNLYMFLKQCVGQRCNEDYHHLDQLGRN